MTPYQLTSPSDAAEDLARVFIGHEYARIEVLDDKCFKDNHYWHLGEIYPKGSGNFTELRDSICKGRYEWQVHDYPAAEAELKTLLQISLQKDNKSQDQTQKSSARVNRIMDATATIAARVGYFGPIFDPGSLEEMPFNRPTTIITDTSGVLQGGLDFVARYLHPAARIKVPAVVHMEIVNQSDSFLKRRRATKINTSALLLDHLVSQGGQRALLRLELSSDTEVERTLLVGDPLRNAFQRDTDSEWLDLNLSVPLRSYCDRLIIEAARQHQGHSSPGHPIRLLTSDQGFARMALAEGLVPLYFRSISAQMLFGRRFAGVAFHPFASDLTSIPLSSAIWELATCFGTARLTSPNGRQWVEVTAIGEKLAWSPMHSHNDLLWLRSSDLPPIPLGEGTPVPVSHPRATKKDRRSKSAVLRTRKQPLARAERVVTPAFYRFNVERMLQLVWQLTRDGRLREDRAARVVKTTQKSAFAEYARFLTAGKFATLEGGSWVPTDTGIQFSEAISRVDHTEISSQLARIPSFQSFFDSISSAKVGLVDTGGIPQRAEPTYKLVGELVCAAAPIANEGYFATLTKPSLEQFVSLALDRFAGLDTGDGLVSVGSWLEGLIRQDGIHPERARRYLDEASAQRLLVRSTEGSTTDTRHDQHAIRVLRMTTSGPRVEPVYLYRGDFLIPNKSSSSIRLGRAAP